MNDTPLPQALEMEQATIGAVFLNPEVIGTATALLPNAADMHDQRHAWIWEECLECFQTHTLPDVQIVAEGLRCKGRLDSAGGLAYLVSLTDHARASSQVGAYAQAVAAAAVRRRTIAAGTRIVRLGYDESLPLDKLPAQAQAELDAAIVSVARRGGTNMADLMSRKWESYREDGAQGVCTGFRDLDRMTGGLQRSDLTILAARPAVGKTSLVLNIAQNVARDNKRVQFYSLEMSAEQLADRMIAMDTGIDTQKLRLRRIRSGEEYSTIADAMSNLAKLPMWIEDDGALSIADLRARAIRNASLFGPPDLIVIDYLQLMGGGGDEDNRVQEVSSISRGLKQLARALNVPIIALSQLSRAVEKRASQVPMLSDLRESGSIEQDADIVMFIYREELYDPTTDKKGIAEIHIAKHRNGPEGVVPMRFDGPTTKFHDLSYREPIGY